MNGDDELTVKIGPVAGGDAAPVLSPQELDYIERVLAPTSADRERILNTLQSTASWLAGTLVALNAGALATTLSADLIEPSAIVASGRFFLAGVAVAVAGSILNYWNHYRAAVYFTALHYARFNPAGFTDENMPKLPPHGSLRRITRLVWAAGGVSIAAFGTGCWIVGERIAGL
ncbi:MAG TPA: hypothetical protein VGW34_09570 [Allosphingosinicella sp.]|nr:hypothetical protein [Allosphingosinicella sp.]